MEDAPTTFIPAQFELLPHRLGALRTIGKGLRGGKAVMTPAALKSYSHKDLVQMAKQGGVRNWHTMRKDQLVKAIVSANKSTPVASPAKKATAPLSRSAPAKPAARS